MSVLEPAGTAWNYLHPAQGSPWPVLSEATSADPLLLPKPGHLHPTFSTSCLCEIELSLNYTFTTYSFQTSFASTKEVIHLKIKVTLLQNQQRSTVYTQNKSPPTVSSLHCNNKIIALSSSIQPFPEGQGLCT